MTTEIISMKCFMKLRLVSPCLELYTIIKNIHINIDTITHIVTIYMFYTILNINKHYGTCIYNTKRACSFLLRKIIICFENME